MLEKGQVISFSQQPAMTRIREGIGEQCVPLEKPSVGNKVVN